MARGIPTIWAPGNADFIIGGPIDAAQAQFPGKRYHKHNPHLTAVRTDLADLERIGDRLIAMMGEAKGPMAFFTPLGGDHCPCPKPAGPARDGGGMSGPFLSPEDVGDIVAILDGSDYRELDIATARFRLKVRRDGDAGGWSQEWQWAAQHAPAQTAGTAAPDTPDGLVAIRAPLPGTFYRAPAPGAAPFVE
ncbi:hypothetical protein E4T56_gene8461, partial [Termitomyces sp. T112]